MFLLRYLWHHYVRFPRGWYAKARRKFVERRIHHYWLVFNLGEKGYFKTAFKVKLFRPGIEKPYNHFLFEIKGDKEIPEVQELKQLDLSTAFWASRKLVLGKDPGGEIQFFYQTDEDWYNRPGGFGHAHA